MEQPRSKHQQVMMQRGLLILAPIVHLQSKIQHSLVPTHETSCASNCTRLLTTCLCLNNPEHSFLKTIPFTTYQTLSIRVLNQSSYAIAENIYLNASCIIICANKPNAIQTARLCSQKERKKAWKLTFIHFLPRRSPSSFGSCAQCCIQSPRLQLKEAKYLQPKSLTMQCLLAIVYLLRMVERTLSEVGRKNQVYKFVREVEENART